MSYVFRQLIINKLVVTFQPVNNRQACGYIPIDTEKIYDLSRGSGDYSMVSLRRWVTWKWSSRFPCPEQGLSFCCSFHRHKVQSPLEKVAEHDQHKQAWDGVQALWIPSSLPPLDALSFRNEHHSSRDSLCFFWATTWENAVNLWVTKFTRICNKQGPQSSMIKIIIPIVKIVFHQSNFTQDRTEFQKGIFTFIMTFTWFCISSMAADTFPDRSGMYTQHSTLIMVQVPPWAAVSMSNAILFWITAFLIWIVLRSRLDWLLYCLRRPV